MKTTLRSLANVARKELIQTLHDRRVVFMLIMAPILQLVMFGYAVDLEVDHIPTVIVDQDHTAASRGLTEAFVADGTFEVAGRVDDPERAHRALESGDASVVLVIPVGYERDLVRGGRPQPQVLVDATDATRAQVAVQNAGQLLAARGAPEPLALPLATRVLYNPRLETPLYMVPGILATLLLAVTTVVTAMGLARERETGTLEQILVTPIHPATLLAGKCVPYVGFGLLDVVAVLVVGSVLFDVPIHGSLAVIGLGATLYLFSTLGMGILIATLSDSQQQAMLGAFGFILPAMLLSGFFTPIASMPAWLQPLTNVIPMRHFIEIMRRVLIKGATVTDVAPQLIALAIIGVAILTLSAAVFRRRLR